METQPTWSFASIPDNSPIEDSRAGSSTSSSRPQKLDEGTSASPANDESLREHQFDATTPDSDLDFNSKSHSEHIVGSQEQQNGTKPQQRPFYGPRTCRICLEIEEPKFPTDVPTALGIATASSKPSYVSDDPEVGRLLSPCKCKGSQKYVHEGCLNSWRTANPSAARNYWQCPTCKFTYQMTRLHWASMLSSKITQIALTVVVFISCIYILGWIADPILDLWFDPMGTIGDTVSSVIRDVEAREPVFNDGPTTWDEHFLKGFLSLGIIGFFKTVLVMTPWDWLNLRGTGMYYRARRGGRARADNINLVLVIIGAITFFGAVWKMVKALSTRILKNLSDRVLDVGDDEDEGEDVPADEETRKDQ